MADDVIYTEPVYTERSDAGIANREFPDGGKRFKIKYSS